MLPNLKVLICGVVFGLLLFAVTGAGVLLPESNTRVGEIPQISRPMMQRMIVDDPAQAQFHIMTVARRSEELERLRERAEIEVAPAQPESDAVKPSIRENPVSDDILAVDVEAPVPQLTGAVEIGAGIRAGQPSRATEVASVATPGSPQTSPAKSEADVTPIEANSVPVAMLPPISPDADSTERSSSLLKVPLPPLRPTARASSIHRRVLRRVHRVAQEQPDTFGQSLFSRPLLPSR